MCLTIDNQKSKTRLDQVEDKPLLNEISLNCRSPSQARSPEVSRRKSRLTRLKKYMVWIDSELCGVSRMLAAQTLYRSEWEKRSGRVQLLYISLETKRKGIIKQHWKASSWWKADKKHILDREGGFWQCMRQNCRLAYQMLVKWELHGLIPYFRIPCCHLSSPFSLDGDEWISMVCRAVLKLRVILPCLERQGHGLQPHSHYGVYLRAKHKTTSWIDWIHSVQVSSAIRESNERSYEVIFYFYSKFYCRWSKLVRKVFAWAINRMRNSPTEA